MGSYKRRLVGGYNAVVFSFSLPVGIDFNLFTKESHTALKYSLLVSLTGFLGCDFIVSGFMGLPFSYTRKSR